jgi:hypothetical protein
MVLEEISMASDNDWSTPKAMAIPGGALHPSTGTIRPDLSV